MNNVVKYLKNRNFLIISGLVLFNLVLKLLFSTVNQIDIDEPFTIYWAQAPLSELFKLFKDENNPPFFFLLMHFWIKLFGSSLFSVRFLPALFGSLAVIYIYKIGIKFFSSFVAVVASLLYTFSSLATYHSHDVRVYSLFILLSAMSVFYLLCLYDNPQKKSNLAYWVIINIVLTYSHFYGFILLFFEVGFVLLNRQFRQKIWKNTVVLVLTIILAYLPYIKLIITRFLHSKGGTWVVKPDFQAPYFRLVEFSNQPLMASLFLLLIFLAIFFAIKNKSTIESKEWVVYLWFLVPFLFMYVVSFKIPMYISKYMVYMLPAFYLSIAIVLCRLTQKFKKVQLVLGIIIVCLMALTNDPASGSNRQPKETAEFVRKNKTNSTIIFLCPPWLDLNIAYYFNRAYFNDFGNLRAKLNQENFYPVYNLSDFPEENFDNINEAIFIDGWYQVSDPDGTILKKLQSEFSKEEKTEFRGYVAYKYSNKR